MSDEIVAFFVYGTLKRGEVRQSCWPTRPLAVLRGRTRGSLWQVADYPGLLLEGEDQVLGELWLFKAKQEPRILEVIDQVEGYPSLYSRQTVECETLDGQPISATVYVYNRPIPPTVARVEPDSQGVVHWSGKSY